MSQELRNALETSRLEWMAAPTDFSVIDAHLAAGSFVLVAEVDRYCPRTDALMGFDQIFEAAFPSRDLADAALEALEVEAPGSAEVLRVIAPRPEAAPF